MKKLSTLSRKENCFFTKDGQVLKTVQDLLEYLVNCDEEYYKYHVNDQKNDFASWVNNVLLFPELGESLKLSKTINEARDAIMEFFQIFDYRSQWISEEKAFHTVDDYQVKNIQELYYYINNCDDNNFNYHANPKKNDFANWVSDVLLFPSVAAKMRVAINKNDMIKVLKDFLTTSTSYGANPEYEKYINQRLMQDTETGLHNESGPPNSESNILQTKPPQSDTSKLEFNVSKSVISESAVSQATIAQPKIEETINFDKKFEYVREEDPDKNADKPLDNNTFRQFTDEELEKFVNFSKSEKNTDIDLKVEYLKTALQELKNMVRDLRRAEKDPLVADLMLRTIGAKIDYYALSKNVDDYNHIIRLMKDVQHEIEECSEQHSYNIAEEILKDLKLQGLAMKKA